VVPRLTTAHTLFGGVMTYRFSRHAAPSATRGIARRSAVRRRSLPRFTDRMAIGAGLKVSRFCLGIVGNWRLIPQAFEMGINFFFVTTDMHWPLYEASRRGLRALLSRKAIRDDVVVAGACYLTQLEFCVAPFFELVEAVPGLGRVDALIAGGVYSPDLLGRIRTLRGGVAAGRARAVGASFHDRQAALVAANHRVVDLGYVRYNPAHPGARHDLFPQLAGGHAPLFNFKSTRGFIPHDELRARKIDPTLWYPDAPDYYRYALSRPQIAGLLFSIKRGRQLIELEAALGKGGLLPDEEGHLEELAVLTGQS
jgi:hypothetical protein